MRWPPSCKVPDALSECLLWQCPGSQKIKLRSFCSETTRSLSPRCPRANSPRRHLALARNETGPFADGVCCPGSRNKIRERQGPAARRTILLDEPRREGAEITALSAIPDAQKAPRHFVLACNSTSSNKVSNNVLALACPIVLVHPCGVWYCRATKEEGPWSVMISAMSRGQGRKDDSGGERKERKHSQRMI